MFNKVFCIGFNKTGTTSLHKLFTEFGLRSWHGFYSHIPVTDPLFSHYQCFSDGELHDFELLDRTFPRSKFIVTTRRFEDWLISRIRYVEFRRSIGMSGPMRREYEASPEVAVKAWIDKRLRYHRQVAEYFSARNDDLLIIDVCDSGDSLQTVQAIVRFLNLTASPTLMFPRENDTRSLVEARQSGTIVRTKSAVQEEVRAAFRSLGLGEDVQTSVFP